MIQAALTIALLCASEPALGGAPAKYDPVGVPPPIRDAAILLAGGDTPPGDEAAWQPVTLPDDWSRRRPTASGDAWYRLAFDVAPEDAALSVVYVPRLNMVGIPFVNGHPIGAPGRFSEPMSRLWYRPQLHWIPADLLRRGPNVIHFRIRTYPDAHGGLSEVYVGPPAGIVPLWKSHVLRQVTAMQITTGITGALSLLVLVAWVVLRWHGAYGYFGIATLFWTLHATLVLMTEIPIAAVHWEALIFSSLIWVVVAMMMFALRFAGLKRPWLERGVLAYGVFVPILLLNAGIARISAFADACLFVLIAIGAYEFKILFDVARRARTAESFLLVAAAGWVIWLGAHDLLNHRGSWGYSEPFDMHYGLPVLFIAVFWNLLGQVAAARRAAEDLNLALESRVKQKADELDRSHERLRAAYASQALASERERIMRDMHDGVGSQLIATRQLAERGALRTAELTGLLDECIDDLRLMIDSLETTDGDLLTVLGNLRYRLSDRLSRQAIRLIWNVSELPNTEGLTPREILHVLRIVQEAFTNVLKHARASEVVFSAVLERSGRNIELRVHDNGRGLGSPAAGSGPPERSEPGRGRGLGNMARRATSLGGTLHVAGEADGWTVLLSFPRVRAGSAE